MVMINDWDGGVCDGVSCNSSNTSGNNIRISSISRTCQHRWH